MSIMFVLGISASAFILSGTMIRECHAKIPGTVWDRKLSYKHLEITSISKIDKISKSIMFFVFGRRNARLRLTKTIRRVFHLRYLI